MNHLIVNNVYLWGNVTKYLDDNNFGKLRQLSKSFYDICCFNTHYVNLVGKDEKEIETLFDKYQNTRRIKVDKNTKINKKYYNQINYIFFADKLIGNFNIGNFKYLKTLKFYSRFNDKINIMNNKKLHTLNLSRCYNLPIDLSKNTMLHT